MLTINLNQCTGCGICVDCCDKVFVIINNKVTLTPNATELNRNDDAITSDIDDAIFACPSQVLSWDTL